MHQSKIEFFLAMIKFFFLKIICKPKAKVGEIDIKTYRILRLNQFVNIYSYIKQHVEALRIFQPDFNNEAREVIPQNSLSFSTIDKLSSEKPTTSNTALNNQNSMTDSKLFDL